jgi:hypothetical protein
MPISEALLCEVLEHPPDGLVAEQIVVVHACFDSDRDPWKLCDQLVNTTTEMINLTLARSHDLRDMIRDLLGDLFVRPALYEACVQIICSRAELWVLNLATAQDHNRTLILSGDPDVPTARKESLRTLICIKASKTSPCHSGGASIQAADHHRTHLNPGLSP